MRTWSISTFLPLNFALKMQQTTRILLEWKLCFKWVTGSKKAYQGFLPHVQGHVPLLPEVPVPISTG